jgi:hypothetical protein
MTCRAESLPACIILSTWQQCIEGASSADVRLFLSMDGERACGQLIELGAALASGKQCFIVSPTYWWSVQHHPLCRVFTSLQDAVAALVAMQHGERERAARSLRAVS